MISLSICLCYFNYPSTKPVELNEDENDISPKPDQNEQKSTKKNMKKSQKVSFKEWKRDSKGRLIKD